MLLIHSSRMKVLAQNFKKSLQVERRSNTSKLIHYTLSYFLYTYHYTFIFQIQYTFYVKAVLKKLFASFLELFLLEICATHWKIMLRKWRKIYIEVSFVIEPYLGFFFLVLFLAVVQESALQLQLSQLSFENDRSCARNHPVAFLFSIHLTVNFYAALQVHRK